MINAQEPEPQSQSRSLIGGEIVADGSLIFDTKIDNSKFNKGIEEQKKNIEKVGTVSRKTFSEASAESGKTTDEIKQDVANLAKEYQKQYGMNVPNSYKKAYKDMGLYSSEAEREVSCDAKEMAKSHEQNSEKSEKTWKNSFSAIGKAASATFAVAAKAVTAVSGALTAGAGAAIVFGSSFETSLAQLSTIADTNAVSMDEFSSSIKELSNQTGVAASDLALVAYNAISAGTSTEDAMNMVKTATDLATGGFTSTEAALSVLTTAVNAYGDSAGTVEEISDSLIMVQNLGVTTVDKLASSMGKAIATGSAYGISIGNIESSYVSLTKQGISTEEATTYMASMFNELGDSGSEVGKILTEKTGASFGQLMDEGYSLADILGILNESVDGNTEALMNLWGSAEAGKASNAIINEGLETFNDNLNTIQNSSGATQAAVEAMQQTFEYKAGQIKEAAVNLGISIYESFSDSLSGEGGALDVVSGWLNKLQSAFEKNGATGLVGALGEIISDLAARAAEFAPQMMNLAVDLLKNLVSGLKSNASIIIKGALSVITNLVEGVLSMLPDIIDLGLQIIVNLALGIAEYIPKLIPVVIDAILQIVNTIINNIDMIIDAAVLIVDGLVNGLIGAIPQLIDGAIALLMAIVDAIPVIINAIIDNLPMIIDALVMGLIGGIPNLLNGAVKLFMAIVQALPQINVALLEALPRILLTILTTLGGLAESLWTEVLSPAIEKFLEWGSGIIETGKQAASDFLNNVIEFICQLPENIFYWLGYATGAVVAWTAEMISNAISAGSSFVENIINFIKTLPSRIYTWFSNTITKVLNFKKDMSDKAKEAGKGFFDNITDALSNLPEKMKEIGSNIVSGIWNGISSGWSWLINSVKDLANSLFQGAKDALDIHSPSKKFKWIGEMCIEGMNEPLENYNPYETFNATMKANAGVMKANFIGNTDRDIFGGSTINTTSQTFNIYQPIKSPSELMRAVRLEQQYGLAGG